LQKGCTVNGPQCLAVKAVVDQQTVYEEMLCGEVTVKRKEIGQMSHSEGRDDPAVYQIQVRGILDDDWSDWFDGLTICPQANGDTLLAGPVRDQPALHGLLAKIRDLGLPLLLVKRMDGT